MFNAIVVRGDILKKLFRGVSRVNDEIIIQASPEELTVTGMDRGHTIYTQIKFEKDFFDVYECKKEVKLCVNMDHLFRIFKRVRANDMIELKYENHYLTVIIENQRIRTYKLNHYLTVIIENQRIRTYKLLLLNDFELPEPPDIELPVAFYIHYGLLKDKLNDAQVNSEKITFHHEPGTIKIFSKGESGSNKTVLETESKTETIERSSYSISKLKSIIDFGSAVGHIKISYGEEDPIRLIGIGSGFDAEFLIAPMVDVD